MVNEEDYSVPELTGREISMLGASKGTRAIRPHRTLVGALFLRSREKYSPLNVILAIDDKRDWLAIDFSCGKDEYENESSSAREARRVDRVLQGFLERDFLLNYHDGLKTCRVPPLNWMQEEKIVEVHRIGLFALDNGKKIPRTLSKKPTDSLEDYDFRNCVNELAPECIEKISSLGVKDFRTLGVSYNPECILEIGANFIK